MVLKSWKCIVVGNKISNNYPFPCFQLQSTVLIILLDLESCGVMYFFFACVVMQDGFQHHILIVTEPQIPLVYHDGGGNRFVSYIRYVW